MIEEKFLFKLLEQAVRSGYDQGWIDRYNHPKSFYSDKRENSTWNWFKQYILKNELKKLNKKIVYFDNINGYNK